MDFLVYFWMVQVWGIEGWVKVLFIIISDGCIDDIQVLELVLLCMFDCEVCQVMVKWCFELCVSGGKIVVCQVIKMFFFKIEKCC